MRGVAFVKEEKKAALTQVRIFVSRPRGGRRLRNAHRWRGRTTAGREIFSCLHRENIPVYPSVRSIRLEDDAWRGATSTIEEAVTRETRVFFHPLSRTRDEREDVARTSCSLAKLPRPNRECGEFIAPCKCSFLRGRTRDTCGINVSSNRYHEKLKNERRPFASAPL